MPASILKKIPRTHEDFLPTPRRTSVPEGGPNTIAIRPQNTGRRLSLGASDESL